MLQNIKKRKDQGFTIIEVLIVLAIAGLILLVVFMAVPALQRNSRNTQRKADVSALLGAVSEYSSNSGGGLPTTDGNFTAVFTGSVPKLGFYSTAAQATYDYNGVSRGATAPTAPAGNDTVAVYNYLKCNGNVATTAGASSRSVAALYNIEGSGGDVAQCQES